MIRRQLVAIGLTLVVMAVVGLLYLQAVAQGRATRPAWLVTRPIVAGTLLDQTNVKQVRVADSGDPFNVLESSPLHRRAAHAMSAATLLGPDDLLSEEEVQVPVSVRAAPGLAAGDSVDLYAVVGPRTVLVGRHLLVFATGNPLTLLVAAADEPSWVALEANNVTLFAARSSGVGVPANPTVTVTEAIATLSGAAQSGPVLVGTPPATTPPPPPAGRSSPRPQP
jgi:hypothetical protein